MMFRNPRVRALLGTGTALAVVAGIGIGVATSSSAAGTRYVTAVTSTGDVTQTYTASGTVTRRNTSVASFSVDGTVRTVKVGVGEEVDAGDVLAVLGKGELQLAVLNAETAVARAKASLYSAEHPATASGSSGSSGGPGSTGGSGSTGVTIDPTVLNEAVSRINLAILDESGKCSAIFSSILPAADPVPTGSSSSTATPSASASPTASASPSASASPTATASAEPTPTASTATAEASAAPADDNPVATASASQLAKALEASDFTDDELKACANARAEVLLANTNLQTVVTQLTTPKPATGSVSSAKKSSTSSSSSSVSASAVAGAKADLLQAEQQLAAAEDDLSAAELVAPISGTVGVVGLAKGDSASAGSITIVGSGSAVVSFELPLATRKLVAVGQSVTVTPAGSTTTLPGKVTAIASLQTSGTSGSSSTYATTVSVADPDGLLASGATASVLIPVKSVTGVVRLPASAVTPTGTGTATVQVVDAANATRASTVQVQTGAVGGGWVQVTSGLDAGSIVVLADNTADIPSNQFNRRTTSTASASSSASATAVPAATAGATSAPGASPSATVGR